MKVKALQCPVCDIIIWSRSRHDFRHCDCTKCHIDGGRAYTTMGWEPGLLPIIGTLDTETDIFTVDDMEDLYQ